MLNPFNPSNLPAAFQISVSQAISLRSVVVSIFLSRLQSARPRLNLRSRNCVQSTTRNTASKPAAHLPTAQNTPRCHPHGGDSTPGPSALALPPLRGAQRLTTRSTAPVKPPENHGWLSSSRHVIDSESRIESAYRVDSRTPHSPDLFNNR